VLEPGGGVGQADPLLELLEGQAFLEGEGVRNLLSGGELDHGILLGKTLTEPAHLSRPQEEKSMFSTYATLALLL
jgi:hypothetical protein